MLEFSDYSLLKAEDIFIVPFALLILFLFALKVRRNIGIVNMRKYFLSALILRFLFAFIHILVINYVFGYGDTNMYYTAVSDLRRALLHEPSLIFDIYFNLKLEITNPVYKYFMYDNAAYTHLYMGRTSNYILPRIAVPFSFIFLNNYFSLALVFSFISFLGCWSIFTVFVKLYPNLHKKIALSFLYLPSLLFWSSSFLKDSFSVGALGFIIYALYNIFFARRFIFQSLFLLFVFGYLLFLIKPYILLCFIPGFIVIFSLLYTKHIKDSLLKKIYSGALILVAFTVCIFVLTELDQSELTEKFALSNIINSSQAIRKSFEQSAEAAGSNYYISASNNSIFSYLISLLIGLFTTLFRPFLWESNNVLMLFNAFEVTLILILTIKLILKVPPSEIFKHVINDKILIICVVYIILFASFIGITTTNFGALSRYRIPCIPFFILTIFIIMDKSKKFDSDVILSNRLF